VCLCSRLNAASSKWGCFGYKASNAVASLHATLCFTAAAAHVCAPRTGWCWRGL
jgi:hypothetical protein